MEEQPSKKQRLDEQQQDEQQPMVPEHWIECARQGKALESVRLIPFKAPMPSGLGIAEEHEFTPVN